MPDLSIASTVSLDRELIARPYSQSGRKNVFHSIKEDLNLIPLYTIPIFKGNVLFAWLCGARPVFGGV